MCWKQKCASLTLEGLVLPSLERVEAPDNDLHVTYANFEKFHSCMALLSRSFSVFAMPVAQDKSCRVTCTNLSNASARAAREQCDGKVDSCFLVYPGKNQVHSTRRFLESE